MHDAHGSWMVSDARASPLARVAALLDGPAPSFAEIAPIGANNAALPAQAASGLTEGRAGQPAGATLPVA